MGKALIIKGANFSSIAVDTIEITVGTPTIQIDIYGNVAITSPNGEAIYYTTDGSTPTDQSTKYTGGFTVQMDTTVKAVCYLGGNYSEVVSMRYNGTLQAPVINITSKGVVTITATNGASIRYTTDGQTDPSSSSGTEYTEPFKVESGVVVKAIAYLSSGDITISSSVTTSDPAVVVEGIKAGYAFAATTGGTSGVEVEDATRYISPAIPIEQGTTIVWGFSGATFGRDFICFFNGNAFVRGQNTSGQTSREFVVSDVAGSANNVRFCCPMGSQYNGQHYVKVKGASTNLWTYDGSTE